jgi:hypothetical protein
MLSIVKLSVIKLSVVMLSVMEPQNIQGEGSVKLVEETTISRRKQTTRVEPQRMSF